MNINIRTTLSPFMNVSYGNGNGDKNNIQKANKAENLTEQQRKLQVYQDFAEEYAKNKQLSNELQALTEKMKNGKMLTAEEEQYLKTQNPEMYKEAEEIAKESKKYQKALEEAETKEDVEDLKVNTLSQYASELKSVKNNPYIPEGKKLEVAEKISKKLTVIVEHHTNFVMSEKFDELPTEFDINKEEASTTKTQKDVEDEEAVIDEKSIEENVNYIKSRVKENNEFGNYINKKA